MDLLQTFVLSIVQGLTEFLPISSSAHLILLPEFLGWPDQGLAFDVAVHVGTLLAVLGYFRREVLALTVDWTRSLVARRSVGESRLAWSVLFATIAARGSELHRPERAHRKSRFVKRIPSDAMHCGRRFAPNRTALRRFPAH